MKFSAAQFMKEHPGVVEKRIEDRTATYLKLLAGQTRYLRNRVLLVGDRPGPGAPKEVGFHHTPFCSTKYSSGWINAQLEARGIAETELLWINSTHHDGTPFDVELAFKAKPRLVIGLGGNANKWLYGAKFEAYHVVPHPQYWKRFMASAEVDYPLFELLTL